MAPMSFVLKDHHSTTASSNQPLLYRTNKPKPLCKILFYTLSIFAILVSAIFLLPNYFTTTDDDYLSTSSPSYICRKAVDPKTCRKFMLEQVYENGAKPSDPVDLLQKFLINQSDLLNQTFMQTKNLQNQINERKQGPLAVCIELLDQSIDLVSDSIQALSNQAHADAQAWLSGVLTNHVTCIDGLSSQHSMRPVFDELVSRSSATLAILAAVSEEDKEMSRNLWGGLPSWVTAADRKLMEMSGNAVKADLTVAQDGSGTHRKVGDAIAAAPDKSNTRFVIYVKKGTYKENVEVGKDKWNVMLVGDGQDSSIITGNLNYVDGTETFYTATLAAVGQGFILQDIRIQNTAGPEKHQAVALRVGADKSVINRCRIEAYQDTLYPHSKRQFYRDTYVRGTVDYIFGNAAVVFQKCTLEARKPMKNQKNMVTAQGRTDENQNTGTSIQDCEIKAGQDLEPFKDSFPTYLGRPWKEYSRTVVMQSYIWDLIDPAGWAEWNGTFALDTLYYGEYKNRGPGSGTSKRVKWKGYHVITNSAEAAKFTVKEFIQGSDWIAAAGVDFYEGLSGGVQGEE